MVVVQRSPAKGRVQGFSFGANNYSAIAVLLLLNLLCFQLGRNYEKKYTPSSSNEVMSVGSSFDPLRPQPGGAKPLPAIHVEDDSAARRKIYGGKGDGKHLGGWTDIDIQGLSPYLWRHMIKKFGIHSIIDVGCGRGISTTWFIMNGIDSLCVEGSHDAYLNSMLPDKDKQMVEHDFSRGPYWPEKTYDAVWCVEFLEHVGRNYHKNYIPVFRKAAIIFVTHSSWGGWHHVEVHQDEWWINKYELYGFKYMHDLTIEAREVARSEAMKGMNEPAVNGELPNPQNLYSLLVFFNPAVGSLPQHAHLFAEPGCFKEKLANGTRVNRECGGPGGREEETPLAPQFQSLPILPENHKRWEEHVRARIKPKK